MSSRIERRIRSNEMTELRTPPHGHGSSGERAATIDCGMHKNRCLMIWASGNSFWSDRGVNPFTV
jgi:hypothetical protein